MYYYSQLASQFGMNFADYPYVANPTFSGANLGPSSPGVEHPSPIHLRPQADAQASVDLSQGHCVREPSDLYGEGHGLTLPSPVLELSHSSCVLLDGSADVPVPGVTVGNQKCGDTVPDMTGTTHRPLENQKCGDTVPDMTATTHRPLANQKCGDNVPGMTGTTPRPLENQKCGDNVPGMTCTTPRPFGNQNCGDNVPDITGTTPRQKYGDNVPGMTGTT